MGRYRGGRSRSPAPIAFLVAVAFVFGGYYLLQGFQTFLRTGGLGVDEATQQAQLIGTATAARVTRAPLQSAMTLRPTATPPPECQDFRVSVPAGIVREGPASNAPVLTQLTQGTLVCVLGRETNSEWYTLDLNTSTRRIDLAYMHETVIEAVNPTPTPTRTVPATVTFTAGPPTETPRIIVVTATPLLEGIPLMPGLATVTLTPEPQS